MASSLPKLLEKLHAIPRRLLDGAVVGNTFQISNLDYIKAVLFQAGAFWSLAALTIIVFTIAYIAGCCCGRKSGKPRRCGRLGCCGVTYLLTSFAMAAAAVAGVMLVGRFNTGLGDVISSVNGFTGLLSNTTILAETGAVAAATTSATAADAYTTAQSIGASQPALDGIQALQYAAGNVSLGASAVYKSLNDTISAIRSDLRTDGSGALDPHSAVSPPTDHIDLPAARASVYGIPLAIAAAAAAWALFSACILAPFKVSACLFRATSALTILMGTLLLALAGVLYAVAVIGSDVCADPNGAVVAVINATTSDMATVASDSVFYYATCGSNPGLAPAGVLAKLDDLITGMAATQGAIEAVNATVTADGTLAPLAPYVVDLYGNISVASGAAAGMATAISCGPVNAVWNGLVNGLCQSAILGVAETFLAVAVAAGLMLLLLVSGACVNCRHPGDVPGPSRDEEYARAIEDMRAARVASIAATSSPYYGSSVVAGKAVGLAPVAPAGYQSGAKTWR